MRREVRGAEEHVVLGREGPIVLAIHEPQVDAVGRRRLGEDGAELHEERGPRRAVVRAWDGLLSLDRVGSLVGDGPRVPVCYVQDPIRFRWTVPREYVAKRKLFAVDGRVRPTLDDHGIGALRHGGDDPVPTTARAVGAGNTRTEIELRADQGERGQSIEWRVRSTMSARTEKHDRAQQGAQSCRS